LIKEQHFPAEAPGEVIAGPAKGETILTAQGSLEAVLAAKVACDVGGHYSRPDVFQLLVQMLPLARVIEHMPADATTSAGGDVPAESAFGALSAGTDSEQKTEREIPMDQPTSPTSRQ